MIYSKVAISDLLTINQMMSMRANLLLIRLGFVYILPESIQSLRCFFCFNVSSDGSFMLHVLVIKILLKREIKE